MGSRLKWSRIVVVLTVLYLTLSLIPRAQGYTVHSYYLGHTNDGYILGSSSVSYGTARNLTTGSTPQTNYNYMYIGQENDSATTYNVWRSYLFFDTSAIPNDATINNATLSLYIHTDSSTQDFNVTIQTGAAYGKPEYPLEQGDYNQAYYYGAGGTMNTSDMSAGFNNITLTSAGLTWISPTGRTDLVLRSNRDIANTIGDTQNEYMLFYTREGGSAYAPRLYVGYTSAGGNYDFHGAFDEDGIRDGAINVTVFLQNEPSTMLNYPTGLDGSESLSTADIPIAAYFDIGNNESRTYYFYQLYEEVYVIRPSDNYRTYTMTVVDMVGVDWAYLESVLNINGTDLVVERWDVQAVTEMPFTMSWGVTYKMRLVCSEGVYYYRSFTAGASLSQSYSITQDMFPLVIDTTDDVTVTGTRQNGTWLRAYYYDSQQETNWIYVAFYGWDETTPTLYTNQSTYTITYNWYAADNETDYWILITSNHDELGTKSWTFSAPAPYDDTNPWSGLSALGTGFPIAPAQFVGMGIVLLFFSVFSQANVGVGLVVGVLIAAVLTLIGFLSIGWSWLTTTMAVVVIIALSIHKDRERNI
jgi:hypothetical protein